MIFLPKNAKIVLNIKTATPEQFRAERNKHLGGSDAGVILEYNRFKSPFMLAVEKQGKAPEQKDNVFMARGRELEPILRDSFPANFAAWYANLNKGSVPVSKCSTEEHAYVYRSTVRPWMGCSPDGLIEQDGAIGLLECKVASEWSVSDWDNDSVPDVYYAQVQHNMDVLGLTWTYFAVYLNGTYAIRYVPRNEAFIKDMIEQEKAFWDEYVVGGRLPDPMGYEAEGEFLSVLYSQPNDIILFAPELETLCGRYLELNKEIAALEDMKTQIQIELKNKLGNHQAAVAGKHKVSWTRYNRDSFDTTRFKAEKPDVYKAYVKSSTSTRMVVK